MPARLSHPAGEYRDFFGSSVAFSGDTILVGAEWDEVVSGHPEQGSVLVYRRAGSGWAFESMLTASDGHSLDSFGHSAALEGDTALVGTVRTGAGSAYIFTRSGEIWTQQAKLTASDGERHDNFGASVAISGDTAIVGAGAISNRRGTAYVFVRSGTIWTQQAKLTASDGVINAWFGSSVALAGDTAVVGAEGESGVQGSAYVFTRSGTTWTQQSKLRASDSGAYNLFGASVALSGDTVVVGADGEVNGEAYRGAAYIFTRSGGLWTQQTKLNAPDAAHGDVFGCSVAISGNTVVVGAGRWYNDRPGAAFVFTRSGTTWTQRTRLAAPGGAQGNFFGASVALSEDGAVIGAPRDDIDAVDQGSAWVFSHISCPADFDADGFATSEDFELFVAAFEIGDECADFDRDGFVTGTDFDLYVQAFEAGC